VLTALALPPILLVGLGAVQLQSVYSDKAETQDIADAAALWGAQQLTVTPTGVDQRTIAWADAQLGRIKANATASITAEVVGPRLIKVSIDTNRPSFFMNMFPAGGFQTHVESTAEGLAQSPLCVLTTGDSGGDDVKISNSARLLAPDCLVHSNQNVTVSGGGAIQADQVEAVGGASGPITPTASTGAPSIPDPFAGLPTNTALKCLLGNLLPIISIENGGTFPLPAGVHQFDLELKNGSTLQLSPGDHWFCGDVKLKSNSKMVGDDVVLIFDPDAGIDWKESSNISLNGRKSGAYAGSVVVDSRQHSGEFYMNADGISNITGTIYVPSATLKVDGSKVAGSSSAWTVVTAKRFEAINGANLMINDGYASSPVPVPSGVGPRGGGTRLVR
jgi:hypothetical protein